MTSRLGLAVVILGTIISFQGFAQSDLSARERYLYLRYSKIDRDTCRRMEKNAYGAGQRQYRLLFRSCTDFLLAGGSFDMFFTPQDPELDRFELCYDSGFRYGFVQESVRQWTPCADQYSKALAQSNEDLVEQCKKLSNGAAKNSASFSEDLMHSLETSEDPKIIEEFARIFYMTELGYGYKVWDKILDLTAIPKIDKAACSIILSKNLLGE